MKIGKVLAVSAVSGMMLGAVACGGDKQSAPASDPSTTTSTGSGDSKASCSGKGSCSGNSAAPATSSSAGSAAPGDKHSCGSKNGCGGKAPPAK